MELSAANARELRKALMAKAASLVRDAELLLRPSLLAAHGPLRFLLGKS